MASESSATSLVYSGCVCGKGQVKDVWGSTLLVPRGCVPWRSCPMEVVKVFFTQFFWMFKTSFSSSNWWCFPSCCLSAIAWCMSIITMASFPKITWDSLFRKQGHLQLGELLFLILVKAILFYPSLEYSPYVFFWQPLLHKELLFLPGKYCLTRAGRVFLRQTDRQVWPLQVGPLTWQSCAHCMAVTMQALPSLQQSSHRADSQQALWEAVSDVTGLGYQLYGTFVEVPQGTGHSWGLLMEQWRPLHIFVISDRWYCVSWMPAEHSAEGAGETSSSKNNDMGKA